jgi:esterase/lipase superfamily enzyme
MKARLSRMLAGFVTAISLLFHGCDESPKMKRASDGSPMETVEKAKAKAESKHLEALEAALVEVKAELRSSEEAKAQAEAHLQASQKNTERLQAELREMVERHKAMTWEISKAESMMKSESVSLPVDRPKGEVFPVWFATNRKPVGETTNVAFSAERRNGTAYGRVDVFVPEAHRFGETGNGFLKRLLRGDLRDDRLRLQKTELQKMELFYDEIRQRIDAASRDGYKPQALLFLHGFNVTFEEAAIRAAQVGFDLGVPGPTAFFSWPSLGDPVLSGYRADEKMIVESETAIADFLAAFCEKSGATNICFIAHSMGNRGLLSALKKISLSAGNLGKVKFNEIILAAPDVGRNDFLQIAGIYSQFSEHTTLYCSSGDLPLWFSQVVNDGPRAGFFKPYTVVAGVGTIAVPDFDVDLLGHSYFANAEPLLYDMRNVIVRHETANNRQRLSRTKQDGLEFWSLRR